MNDATSLRTAYVGIGRRFVDELDHAARVIERTLAAGDVMSADALAHVRALLRKASAHIAATTGAATPPRDPMTAGAP